MTDPSLYDPSIQDALADLDWKISRSGRAWSQEEMRTKHPLMPGRLDVSQGKLFQSQVERLRLLAALLEQVGLDLALQLARAARARSSRRSGDKEPVGSVSTDIDTSLHGDNSTDLDEQMHPGVSGRTWNYRAIRFEHGDDSHVAIHEVFYEDGRPVAYAEQAAPLMWFAEEGSMTGFKVLARLRQALEMPVLAEDDFLPRDRQVSTLPGPAVASAHEAQVPSGTLTDFERAREASPDAVSFIRAMGGASADFGEELLSSSFDPSCHGGVGHKAVCIDGRDQEPASWDSMPAVGRERFWLPAANRYPLRTLIELRKLRLGPAHLGKGSREAKRARMRKFIRQVRLLGGSL